MLINLHTRHKPETLEEAAQLLRQPDVYPLYGTGASLVRGTHTGVEAVADLTSLIAHTVQAVSSDDLEWPAGATLVAVGEADTRLQQFINAVMPQTLQNAYAVGDLLLEADPNSLLLALLLGLNAELRTYSGAISLDTWLDQTPGQRRTTLIQSVICKGYNTPQFAFEKVSRTPADAPIVGAVGFSRSGDLYAVVVGIAARPVRYSEGVQSQIDDYKGSAVYRTEMAKIVSTRAMSGAAELAQNTK